MVAGRRVAAVQVAARTGVAPPILRGLFVGSGNVSGGRAGARATVGARRRPAPLCLPSLLTGILTCLAEPEHRSVRRTDISTPSDPE